MCGLAGILGYRGPEDLERVVSAMGETLRHRGPDAGAVWCSPDGKIALAHRRLSIVDLSAAGAQPMHSSCGRYVLIYNGEIYNAAELRRELEQAGCRFRGHSDTEVIVEGFSQWGIRSTIERVIGMFAIAVWDQASRTLALIRDRVGIKPLYWSATGDMFIFGSELKALRAIGKWTPVIDRDSVASFLRHSYIPAPFSIYRGVRKLEPGTILTVKQGSEPAIEVFWSMEQAVERGIAERPRYDGLLDGELIDRLDALLSDAVARRLISDVPLGAFLSGGIDSSTVVALMQKASSVPVKTFSIGFGEPDYDEAAYAQAVADHLGTEHTELYVSPQDALAVIPKLPTIYDEPFSDSSQIPTYLISVMTRKHVSVALSGDGGDELFAGYDRYFFASTMRRRFGWLPSPLRRHAADMIQRLAGPRTLERSGRFATLRRKSQTLAVLLGESEDSFYRRLVSHWTEPETIALGGRERASFFLDDAVPVLVPDFMARMQYLDSRTYLPDDILTKVDRASMAASLEVRVPILDHRVVEFSWMLPRRCMIRGGQGKWALRQVLKRYVPERLTDRPKMGFGVPIDRWLRGPLRDWAESLLTQGALADGGLLEPKPIRRLWTEHVSGQRNWQYLLWDVLMFQAWLRDVKP